MSDGATERTKRSVRFDLSSDDGDSPERDQTGLSAPPATPKSSRSDTVSENEAAGDNTPLSETTAKAAPDETLGDLFRIHMVASKGGRKSEFLPRNELETLLTRERIIQELVRAKCTPIQYQPEATEEDSIPTKLLVNLDQLDNRKQVFAILILMGKLRAIVDFIKEGIDDKHLPFELKRGDDRATTNLKGTDSDHEFRPDDWGNGDVEAFESQQWKICVPVFHMIDELETKPPHWEFAEEMVMPFLKSEPVGKGGYGAVRKVKIHAAHHNSSKVSLPRPLTQLRS